MSGHDLAGPPPGPVLDWAATHRRELPWRRTRDPWAILVSELMLQQTQVARVEERYGPLLEAFPTPVACAASATGEVVGAWAGLGYNRRAVDLHRCATEIVGAHDGRVPDDLDALLGLPGIGPYTARAVLAFAFEQEVGVLDVNTVRVLARHAGRRLSRGEAQRLADACVPRGRSWAWNQTMLDLGATVCVSGRPRCDRCPIRPTCGWHRDGLPEPDPARGSAGTGGRQSRFDGSDRQGRGRLVEALRRESVETTRLPEVMGWPGNRRRAERVAEGVVRDGLAVREGSRLRLP